MVVVLHYNTLPMLKHLAHCYLSQEGIYSIKDIEDDDDLVDSLKRSMAVWDVVQDFVGSAESALAQWALQDAGFDLHAYFQRFDALADDLGGIEDPATHTWSPGALATLWGDWRGREAELLTLTAAAVRRERAKLRVLAEKTPILRPARFEAAERALVPAELVAFLEPADQDQLEAGDAVETLRRELPPPPIEVLGNLLRESLAALWDLPNAGSVIALAPGTSFALNTVEDAVTRHFADLPHVVRFPADPAGVGEDGETWELFITAAEKRALSHFASPRSMGAKLLTDPSLRDVPDAAQFLAEWLGYGVLITQATK